MTNNGWEFKRGLDRDFMDKLKALAEDGGWFADVLADEDLILGIRNSYLNVYWRGQSLFKVERKGKTGPLKVSTHPKYLIDPDLSKPVTFDGRTFAINPDQALQREYVKGKTIGRMKRAARVYCGGEKEGVHAIARGNDHLIDTEVAFSCEAQDREGSFAPRIDLACIEPAQRCVRLRFWEAKLYGNPEIRAAVDTEPPVLRQIKGYGRLLRAHSAEVIESYRAVARNLVEIATWAPARTVANSVRSAAEPDSVVEFDERPVGLVIYGYNNAEKQSDRWRAEMDKLRRDPSVPVVCAGDPKQIKLRIAAKG